MGDPEARAGRGARALQRRRPTARAALRSRWRRRTDGGTARRHPAHAALPRDAQLYAAGTLLRGRDGPAILAGDLNGTPWEDAVSRMRRIAGLVSPRQGRGYVYTFDATSWWMKWPLDQIAYRPGFTPVSVERLAPFGSDHYPFLVRLCRDVEVPAGSPPALSAGDRDRLAEADRAVEP